MTLPRVLHCWEGSPDGGGTCMLPHEHDGPHEFTPDNEIGIQFAEIPDDT